MICLNVKQHDTGILINDYIARVVVIVNGTKTVRTNVSDVFFTTAKNLYCFSQALKYKYIFPTPNLYVSLIA